MYRIIANSLLCFIFIKQNTFLDIHLSNRTVRHNQSVTLNISFSNWPTVIPHLLNQLIIHRHFSDFIFVDHPQVLNNLIPDPSSQCGMGWLILLEPILEPLMHLFVSLVMTTLILALTKLHTSQTPFLSRSKVDLKPSISILKYVCTQPLYLINNSSHCSHM